MKRLLFSSFIILFTFGISFAQIGHGPIGNYVPSLPLSGGNVTGATTFEAAVTFKLGPWVDIGAGCAGNGSTDDSTCMQTNITAAIAAGIKAGFVPQKHFAIATALEIDTNNFTLFGLGINSVIRMTTAGGTAIKLAKSATGGSTRDGIKILDMSVIGGIGAGIAIAANEAHYLVLRDLYIRAGTTATSGTGIELTTCYYTSIDNLIISTNFVAPYSISVASPQYGIHMLAGCNDVWIKNVQITGCVQGIRWSGISSVGGHIIGGVFSGNDYGIYSAVGSSYTVNGWTIQNVQNESNTTGDIYGYNFSRCSIIDSAARVNLTAQSNRNTLIGTGYPADQAITNAGFNNTFINCWQVGATLPTDTNGNSYWYNYTDFNPWPPVIVKSSLIINPEFDNGTCTTAKTIATLNGPSQKVTLTAATACVLTFTQPASGTAKILLKIIQSGTTANGTIVGSTAPKWPSAIVPTITATSGAVDIISCYLDGTVTYCVPSQDFR